MYLCVNIYSQFCFYLCIQQPYSSRPPVLHYIVTHNVTDIPNNISQLITHDTNITIHGVHLDCFYFIQVTPVNALGCGQPGYRCVYPCLFCIDTYFGHAAVHVVGPLRMLIATVTEGSMHTTSCSCAGNRHPCDFSNTVTVASISLCPYTVELGVTLPLCALVLVVGCCVTAFVTIKKNRMSVHVSTCFIIASCSVCYFGTEFSCIIDHEFYLHIVHV